MTLTILIPAKPFEEAKTRLSSVLSRDQRRTLAEGLFLRTLSVAVSSSDPKKVRVVTRSMQVAELARENGAAVWREPEACCGLNEALERAAIDAFSEGDSAVLCLPADLPLVEPEDLMAVVQAGQCADVIAPDRNGEGTNALLWHGPEQPRFQFGPGSFDLHLAAIRHRRPGARIVSRPGLALDLDTAADLLFWLGAPALCNRPRRSHAVQLSANVN